MNIIAISKNYFECNQSWISNIITSVFSVTWSSEHSNMLISSSVINYYIGAQLLIMFLLLSMLKIVEHYIKRWIEMKNTIYLKYKSCNVKYKKYIKIEKFIWNCNNISQYYYCTLFSSK